MAAGKTRDELDTDRKLNLAFVRLVEVVGEAASDVRALIEVPQMVATLREFAQLI